MILGERIKKIRTFRGLTQRELGLKLGYEERNADVRVAQYESGYRVPKKDTLMEIAKILNVNYINFITETPGCAEDIIQTFFWLDEDNRNTFHLFQLVRNPGKCNSSDDKSVRYNDRLAKFAKAKKLQENLIASKDAFPSEEAFQHEVAQMNETCEQIKQHLVDTNAIKQHRKCPFYQHFRCSVRYSNSIVAGGLPVQSYITRLTPLTSFTILLVALLSTSHGSCAASAVMKSDVSTALRAIA